MILIFLFLTAQTLGLIVIHKYIDQAKSSAGTTVFKDLPAIGPFVLERPDIAPAHAIILLSVAVLVGTFLVLILAKFKSVLLWKTWYFIAVATTITISLTAFVNPTAGVVTAVILSLWKIIRPNVIIHNATELLVYPGLAAIFVPILTPTTAAGLLVAISFYDVYAVNKSKHMVSMAQFQIRTRTFAGLCLGNPLVAKTATTTQLSQPSATHSQKTQSQKTPSPYQEGNRTAVLGGGDIGFPLLLAGTVLVSNGIAGAALVVIGSSTGLGALLFAASKGKFYPAMPGITLGGLLGLTLAIL